MEGDAEVSWKRGQERSSREDEHFFKLCIQDAFIIILSRLLLRNALNVQILENTVLAKHIGTSPLCSQCGISLM